MRPIYPLGRNPELQKRLCSHGMIKGVSLSIYYKTKNHIITKFFRLKNIHAIKRILSRIRLYCNVPFLLTNLLART